MFSPFTLRPIYTVLVVFSRVNLGGTRAAQSTFAPFSGRRADDADGKNREIPAIGNSHSLVTGKVRGSNHQDNRHQNRVMGRKFPNSR